MSTLKIQASGSAEVVEVPCRLPRFFSFYAWLPARGITKLGAELTSNDPAKAALDLHFLVDDGVDSMDRSLTEAEQFHARKAAHVVWAEIQRRLGMNGELVSVHALAYVAKAYKAQTELQAALKSLKSVLHYANDETPSEVAFVLSQYVAEAFEKALANSYAHAESVRDESEATAKEEARMAVEP